MSAELPAVSLAEAVVLLRMIPACLGPECVCRHHSMLPALEQARQEQRGSFAGFWNTSRIPHVLGQLARHLVRYQHSLEPAVVATHMFYELTALPAHKAMADGTTSASATNAVIAAHVVAEISQYLAEKEIVEDCIRQSQLVVQHWDKINNRLQKVLSAIPSDQPRFKEANALKLQDWLADSINDKVSTAGPHSSILIHWAATLFLVSPKCQYPGSIHKDPAVLALLPRATAMAAKVLQAAAVMQRLQEAGISFTVAQPEAAVAAALDFAAAMVQDWSVTYHTGYAAYMQAQAVDRSRTLLTANYLSECLSPPPLQLQRQGPACCAATAAAGQAKPLAPFDLSAMCNLSYALLLRHCCLLQRKWVLKVAPQIAQHQDCKQRWQMQRRQQQQQQQATQPGTSPGSSSCSRSLWGLAEGALLRSAATLQEPPHDEQQLLLLQSVLAQYDWRLLQQHWGDANLPYDPSAKPWRSRTSSRTSSRSTGTRDSSTSSTNSTRKPPVDSCQAASKGSDSSGAGLWSCRAMSRCTSTASESSRVAAAAGIVLKRVSDHLLTPQRWTPEDHLAACAMALRAPTLCLVGATASLHLCGAEALPSVALLQYYACQITTSWPTAQQVLGRRDASGHGQKSQQQQSAAAAASVPEQRFKPCNLRPSDAEALMAPFTLLFSQAALLLRELLWLAQAQQQQAAHLQQQLQQRVQQELQQFLSDCGPAAADISVSAEANVSVIGATPSVMPQVAPVQYQSLRRALVQGAVLASRHANQMQQILCRCPMTVVSMRRFYGQLVPGVQVVEAAVRCLITMAPPPAAAAAVERQGAAAAALAGVEPLSLAGVTHSTSPAAAAAAAPSSAAGRDADPAAAAAAPSAAAGSNADLLAIDTPWMGLVPVAMLDIMGSNPYDAMLTLEGQQLLQASLSLLLTGVKALKHGLEGVSVSMQQVYSCVADVLRCWAFMRNNAGLEAYCTSLGACGQPVPPVDPSQRRLWAVSGGQPPLPVQEVFVVAGHYLWTCAQHLQQLLDLGEGLQAAMLWLLQRVESMQLDLDTYSYLEPYEVSNMDVLVRLLEAVLKNLQLAQQQQQQQQSCAATAATAAAAISTAGTSPCTAPGDAAAQQSEQQHRHAAAQAEALLSCCSKTLGFADSCRQGMIVETATAFANDSPPNTASLACRVNSLAKGLLELGVHLCTAFPGRFGCNNPSCGNMDGVSEVFGLVRGKACVCGGCVAAGRASSGEGHTAARYCRRLCQAAHWPLHKAYHRCA